jgi:hypothetical protein
MATTTNFIPKPNLNNEMKSYLSLASSGHFPLFFKEWLEEGVNSGGPMSFQVANRNVRDTFKKLSRHRTEQKKKTALTGLAKDERDVFVKSFIKMVEHNVLKDLKTLH